MLSIIVPPCVLTFYTAWMNIATFDILENDHISASSFINFDLKAQRQIAKANIPDQTQELGYESTNALRRLGSLGIVIVFYMIQVLLFFAVLIPLRWWKPQSVFIQN